MSHITVVGGTGYAGSALVAEAAARGHEVTSFSRSLPEARIPNVNYVAGDASDEQALASAIDGADAVVAALSPRGALTDSYREVNLSLARLADTAKVPLYIVGGFSSLRPAAGAPRFAADLSHAPAELHGELTTVSALVADDLPATPETLDWVFISPAAQFGAHAPGERLGHYRVGTDVVLVDGGGEISGADYATGFVDIVEQGTHHRAHLHLVH